MNEFLDEFYRLVPQDKAVLYRAIADKAMQLGFKPRREPTKHLSISFMSSRYKVTILKYVADRNHPSYRLKFFAAKEYSPVFDLSIKKVIEQFDFKYVGCYGCGRCKGELEGYRLHYEDGREYFRCGLELIELMDLNEQIKDEVIGLLERQTEYYQKKTSLKG